MPSGGAVFVGTMGGVLGWCGGVSGQVTMWTLEVVRQLHDSRVAHSRLAVAEERLRFSRDLHDVYGRTLATIGMKSQLAAELARRGDPRAAQEMSAVHELADGALGDVRDIVRGDRDVDPITELAGACSLLRSAGIAVDADDVAQIVPLLAPPARTALAWLLREGVTNVLRHSDARRVELRIARPEPEGADGDRLLVTLRNDGPRDRRGEGGSGLAGLAERVAAAGGRCTGTRERDRYVLRAWLPVQPVRSGTDERDAPAVPR